MGEQNEPKPFVKWAGGKRQLLDALLNAIPEQFNDYYEPFVGGGALYFKLWSLGKIKKAHLSDSNQELINAYLIIRDNLGELMGELKEPKYHNTSECYYEIRKSTPANRVERAARFIYLNKTAYNGLYRVNSKGGFNVPFGRYKNPTILDEENLRLVNRALKNVEITCNDFQNAVKDAKKGDFVYFDPPYHPINGTSFTKYTSDDFSIKDQERLKKEIDALVEKGVLAILSNSDTDKIKQLYSNYEKIEVLASRAINCKAEGRGKITELLIKSWLDGAVY